MQSLALISGLIGALLSAGLGFVARLILDHRAIRIAERKLAYVYLVRVSEVVAMDIVTRVVIKALVPPGAVAELLAESDAYSPTHKVSAVLAEMLKSIPLEEVRADSTYRTIPRFAKAQIESAKDVKLSAEQLSKLPPEVIFDSNRYTTLHGHVMQVIEMWGALFENGENAWLTPEGIHDQWLALVRYADSAKQLRAALIAAGAATPAEAAQLLNRHQNHLLEVVAQKWRDKPRLAAAAAALSASQTPPVAA
jgi:hypothetical protein